MEERNAVRNILKAKLTKEQFEIFQNEDMERLGANEFTIVEAFESADRDLLMMALPGRAGLVGILLKSFGTLQPPADPFHFRPFPATEGGLPQDQAKVINDLATYLLEERKMKKTIQISSVSHSKWMAVEQLVSLKIELAPEAEMEPTRSSDLAAFGWDDRLERAQADRYISHLGKIRKGRSWILIDAANTYPNLLSGDFIGQHFKGTTDVAWIKRGSVRSFPQTGLRCLFKLKKKIPNSLGASQFQAIISLVLANIHSSLQPFVVLTDLVNWWALYWIDGKNIYHYSFTSRALAVGYIEDLLGPDTIGVESLAREDRQEQLIFKRRRLEIPEINNLSDLVGSLPDEEIRSAQAECAVQRLLNIPAISSLWSQLSSPP